MLQYSAVRLEIGFLQKIDPVKVAQNGQERVRRIVRRANGVDIVAPEHFQIALQIADALHIAVDRHGMAVDALELDGDAIDLEHRAVRRDRADADVFAKMLPSAHDAERVHLGRFCRPEARVGDEELRLLPLLAGELPFAVRKGDAAGLIAGEADDARAPAHIAFDPVVVKMPLFAAQ